MFKESFLHFVWQYQYFNTEQLKTLDGEDLEVVHPGTHNHFDGPDFKESKIKIGGIEWNGSVEIHRYSSDWYNHKHNSDEGYQNVVLHVVWEQDKEVFSDDGLSIPTLILKGKIKPGIIRRYRELVESGREIPCQNVFKKVRAITKLGTLERVLTERLKQKSDRFLDLLRVNDRDWEETAYQWLAQGFGFKTNAAPFLNLAQKAPLRVIQKHASSALQVESILFGQAGFLEISAKPPSDYLLEVRREHEFLSKKYGLPNPMIRPEWTFGRVRPSNHPAIRISQLAALLCNCPNIFTFFSETSSLNDFKEVMKIKQSPYWTAHYDLEKKSAKMIGPISQSAIENLMINVTVPFLVALWQDRRNDRYLDRAQNILMQLTAEQNSIVNKWKEFGWKVSNAFDSQGLIHLFNHYCQPKRCLSCGIGTELIGPRNH